MLAQKERFRQPGMIVRSNFFRGRTRGCNHTRLQLFSDLSPALRQEIILLSKRGPLAQRLEQGTHNPLVVGSNPTGPTTLKINALRTETGFKADLVFKGFRHAQVKIPPYRIGKTAQPFKVEKTQGEHSCCPAHFLLLRGEFTVFPGGTEMVGMTGFEPATSASRTQRSARLSYIPPRKTEDKQTRSRKASNLGRKLLPPIKKRAAPFGTALVKLHGLRVVPERNGLTSCRPCRPFHPCRPCHRRRPERSSPSRGDRRSCTRWSGAGRRPNRRSATRCG